MFAYPNMHFFHHTSIFVLFYCFRPQPVNWMLREAVIDEPSYLAADELISNNNCTHDNVGAS